MTLRSPRNHPTTRPSIRRWSRISALIVATAASCGPLAGISSFAADPADDSVLERLLPSPGARSVEKPWFDDDQAEMDRMMRSQPANNNPAGKRESQPVSARPTLDGLPGAKAFDPTRSPAETIFPDAALERATTGQRVSVRPQADPRADGAPSAEFELVPELKAASRLGQVGQIPPAPLGDSQMPPGDEPKLNYNDGSLKTVLPYFDYQPDGSDPCLHQCPRPEECKDLADGRGFIECPPIVQLSESPYEGRLFAENLFSWQAPDIWYNPLYFEDAPLERYGHTHGCLLQPFASAGKFSAQLLALPYQMSIDPLCSHRYSLGWYRPGECAPKLCYQPPLNADAAAATAGFYTGMFYLFP